ncbi:BTB/POZ domain-containing protein Btb1 [Schizosaccharomyces cryophilus OY26]|uniref:BTB/POZ domain-containing protein Btb1 n=1 Tax=Schizosaccharomyces cryophilus (strain OY26 / ATCC MYA-4695 / CBS 11777 / NBRC 106824 / NRRL Y48691) TaxID=653667 RepID=S9VQ39_SCHCR|nr:BTB/POZ domain-containing protein Btb1 [Schizosaccharomyces cryophilus OY26]EPY50078.1 BTB/POZ domain-containing protein Btb1 [Schizosaccharomyces cryophilus OY26]
MSHLLFAYYVYNDIRSFQTLLKQDDIKLREARKGASEKSSSKLNVNTKDRYGRTVLHIAAFDNKNSFVRALLRHKNIDVLIQDEESGYTALHRAIYVGNLEAASLLLSKESSNLLKIKDHEGLSPFQLLYRIYPGAHPQINYPILGNELYSLGNNENSILGFTVSGSQEMAKRVFLYRKQTSDSLSGQLFAPDKIIDIQSSKFHSLVITDEPSPNVYSCGIGAGGRLGFRKDAQYTFTPVSDLPYKVVQISVSQNHSLALTDIGNVYAWGLNSYSALGFNVDGSKKEDSVQVSPKRISALKDLYIIGIAAGDTYSAAWTNSDLYTWGQNEGQLGHPDDSFIISAPRRVAGLTSSVVKATCTSHSIILLLENNSILILSNYKQLKVPVAVDLESPLTFTKHALSLSRFNVRKIVACEDNLAILTEQGEVFVIDLIPLRSGKEQKLASLFMKSNSKNSLKITSFWTVLSPESAANDVAWADNSSLLLCLKNGTCWIRQIRSKKREKASLKQSTKGTYKYSCIENIQMITNVRTNASGGIFTIRNDYRPPPIHFTVPELNDVFSSLLPYKNILHKRNPTFKPAEDEDSPPYFDDDRDPTEDEIQTLFFNPGIIVNSYRTFKASSADVRLICVNETFWSHKFLLSARSSILRRMFRTNKDVKKTTLDFRVDKEGESTLIFNDVSATSVAVLLHYLYSDSLLQPWQWDSKFLNVKEELLKLSRSLDLPHLQEVLPFTVPRQPSMSLARDINALFLSKSIFDDSSDTVIKLEDGELKANSLLLRIHSDYFDSFYTFLEEQAQHKAEKYVVNLPDKNTFHFGLILRHIYGNGSLEIFNDLKDHDFYSWLETMTVMLSISDELLFYRLKEICEQSLLQFLNLKTLNDMLELSSCYHAESLYSRCVDYACHNIGYFLEKNRLSEWENKHLANVSKRLHSSLQEQRFHTQPSKVLNKLLFRNSKYLEEKAYELKVLREFLFSGESTEFWDKSPYRTTKESNASLIQTQPPIAKDLFEQKVEPVRAVELESRQEKNLNPLLDKGSPETLEPPSSLLPSYSGKITSPWTPVAGNINRSPVMNDDHQISPSNNERKGPWKTPNLVDNAKKPPNRANLRELLEEANNVSPSTTNNEFRGMKGLMKRSQKEKKKELSKQQQPIRKGTAHDLSVEPVETSTNAWSTKKPTVSSATKKPFNGILREVASDETPSQVFYKEPKRRISSGSPSSWSLLGKPPIQQPSSLPKSGAQPNSLMAIMYEQQEEIEERKRRLASRKTIEEIQQEEEFQKWWEEESLRVQKGLGMIKSKESNENPSQRRKPKKSDRKNGASTGKSSSQPIDIPLSSFKKGKSRIYR